MTAYPAELQALRQWVCWRLEQRHGNATKIPVNPHTGAYASTVSPLSWGHFAEALAGVQRFHCVGVGFVFGVADPYVGVDLDHCVTPETGEISQLAAHIIDGLQSYTAWSQSGQGVHIIVRAKLPPGRRQGAFGGLYEKGRFFALTGHLYPGTPGTIEARQAELDALHTALFPPVQGMSTRPLVMPPAVALTDADLLDKMFTARNGADIRRLWEGDISGYPSASEADLALCAHLAFWCGGDASRMDALFRQSALYRKGKWNRIDYRERTIGKALEHGQCYEPRIPRSAVSLRDHAVVWHSALREHAIRGADLMRPWHEQAISTAEVQPWH